MTETAKLTASDGAFQDFFGFAVGIDGDTIAVGAYQEDAPGTDRGGVYVFERPAGGLPQPPCV